MTPINQTKVINKLINIHALSTIRKI